MTWRRLVAATAVWAAVLIFGVGIALSDVEAVAIGVGLGVGAALLRFRAGLLGRLVLLALFADVVAWMAPAAVANVAHGEDLAAVAMPLVLAVVACVGLVADLVLLVTRQRADSRATPVLALAAVVLAAALVVSQLGVFGDPARLQAGDELVEMKDAKFVRERIAVEAGPVAVVVDNEDLFWHTFTIDELDVDVRTPVKATRRAVFTARPGTYTYYCAIPGHQAIGMEGVLVVS
jgi:plastocyanin